MPRRREVPKREVLPDPKFGSVDLSKFMNVIMEGGKKAIAERIIYGALDQIEKKAGKDPLEIFVVALNNIKPMVEVKTPSRRRCQLPGAGRSAPGAPRRAGHALAEGIGTQAWREVDVAAPGQ